MHLAKSAFKYLIFAFKSLFSAVSIEFVTVKELISCSLALFSWNKVSKFSCKQNWEGGGRGEGGREGEGELRTLTHYYYACMPKTYHVVYLLISCIGYFLCIS